MVVAISVHVNAIINAMPLIFQTKLAPCLHMVSVLFLVSVLVQSMKRENKDLREVLEKVSV